MTFKKIILVLTEAMDQTIIKEVVGFCKKFKCKLFVLFIIEPNKISRLARLTHQKVENLHKKIEEEGWQLLYFVEDEAVQSGVWTSLHLEDGNMMSILRKYVKAYKIDVALTKRKDETRKLFVPSPVPVLGL